MTVLETLLSGQFLFAALVTGSLYALIALGLNLVYGTMRLLNVAHGEVVMLGAYAAYWAFTALGLSPLLVAPVVAAAGGLLGYLLYRGIFKRLLANSSAAQVQRMESNSLLLFFGLSIVLQNAAALVFTPNNRAYNYLGTVYHLGSVSMTGNRLAALCVAGTCCLLVAVFLGRSVFGLATRAVIERREAAFIVGVALCWALPRRRWPGYWYPCWGSSRPSRVSLTRLPVLSSSSWAGWAMPWPVC